MSRIFKRDESQTRAIPDRVLLPRIIRYMKPYWRSYAVVIGLMVITISIGIISPIITSDWILGELGKDVIDYPKLLILLLIAIALQPLNAFVSYQQQMKQYRTAQLVTLGVRAEVFDHIQSFSHAQFGSVPTGRLVTRDTTDINVMDNLFSTVLLSLVQNAVTIVGIFIAMLFLNWRLALLVLAFSPVIFAFTLVFRHFSRGAHREVRRNVSAMNGFLAESIDGMETTQLYGQEEKKLAEFREANTLIRKNTFKEIIIFGLFRPFIYVLYIASTAAVLWFGGSTAISFALGASTVVVTYSLLYTFYRLVGRFFNPIQALADQFETLQNAFASAERIFEILDRAPDRVDTPEARPHVLEGAVEFRHVWFAYEGEDWVLKDVSFKVNPGDTVAFVGETGAGKSTIMSLIAHNYEIQKGEILFDGISIDAITTPSLRSQIGQMLQDVFLFSGTVRDNITLFSPEIPDATVNEALSFVGADSFVRALPQGLDSPVSERGANFSGGQKQLLSFARAIAYDPKIMILDEATSSIDTASEEMIQASLEKIMTRGTMLVVAHRLSTIQHADMIHVFHDGEIVESGTHQSLLALHGRYYELYMLQYRKEHVNEPDEGDHA